MARSFVVNRTSPRQRVGPVSGEHLRALVRRSPLPVLLIRLTDGRSVEASDSFLAITARDRRSVLAMRVEDYTEEPEVARQSFALVASGALDGYTRHATFRRPSGELVQCDLRISACSEDRRQHAVVSVLPGNWSSGDAVALERSEGNGTTVMGTVDGRWQVDRITADDDGTMAYSPGDLLNRSIFVGIHPEDVGELMFLAAHASAQRGGAFGRVRIKANDGGWISRRVSLQPLAAESAAGYAFTFWPEVDSTMPPGTTDRPELESVMETTIANIRASSIAAWMVAFPTALQLPELSTLTAREYEILLRLASGERVQAIAEGLHLSASTVRNHLTSIFRKTEVGSQGELLALLRGAPASE